MYKICCIAFSKYTICDRFSAYILNSFINLVNSLLFVLNAGIRQSNEKNARKPFEVPPLHLPLAAAAVATAATAVVGILKQSWTKGAALILAALGLVVGAILEWLASR